MKYLKYKGASDAGFFSYYDKESGENKQFDLKEFTVVDVKYKVLGWTNDGGQLFSNEIEKWDEELSVAIKENGNVSPLKDKGGEPIKGTWKEIKESVVNAGGKINILPYCISNGEEIQLEFAGQKFFNFSEALKSINKETTALKYDGFTDEKNGAVKYRSPKFVEGGKAETVIKQEVTEEITAENIPF